MGNRAKDIAHAGSPAERVSQLSKFKDAARELGCSDDESAFDKALKTIASAPPPKTVKKRKKKKPAK